MELRLRLHEPIIKEGKLKKEIIIKLEFPCLHLNSWLYRRKPSVGHEPFKPYIGNPLISSKEFVTVPNQLRWDPFELPDSSESRDFVDGLALIAAAGSPAMRNGLNIFIYSFNSKMAKKAFYNSDGDFLISNEKRDLLLIITISCYIFSSANEPIDN